MSGRLAKRVALGLAALVFAGALTGVFLSHVGPREDPNELTGQVQADLEASRWDRAEAGLARLARLRRPISADWMCRSLLDEGRGRLVEATNDLSHVADGDPLGSVARFREGQLELRRHRLRAAEAALRRALERNPGLMTARKSLTYLYGLQLRQTDLRAQYRALAAHGPLAFEELTFWCRSWDSVEKPEGTVADLAPVVAADPDDQRSRIVLIESLRLLGRRTEAVSALAALSDADPDARAARARLALDDGDDRAADALLAEGPADHPALARLRGQRALARRDAAEAIPQFRIALAADPEDRDAHFGLGHALRLAGRNAEAEPELQTARDLDTLSGLVQRARRPHAEEDLGLMAELARICETLGRLPEARAWYRAILARDPFNADAQTALFRLKDPAS